ncbi:hypothetical protein D7X33_51620, partial [Butyricicoccus sp. 1XD8-22]
MQNNIHDITAKSRLFAMDPFFNALQLMVREMLIERTGYMNRRMNLYLLFWDTLFVEKSRAEEELAYFDEVLLTKDGVPIDLMKNVFYILLKNYSDLKNNLKIVYEEQLLIYFGLARFAISKNDQIASELILKSILPYLNQFINVTLTPTHRQMYVKKVNKLYENISLTER